jgi:hypothetical protein
MCAKTAHLFSTWFLADASTRWMDLDAAIENGLDLALPVAWARKK